MTQRINNNDSSLKGQVMVRFHFDEALLVAYNIKGLYNDRWRTRMSVWILGLPPHFLTTLNINNKIVEMPYHSIKENRSIFKSHIYFFVLRNSLWNIKLCDLVGGVPLQILSVYSNKSFLI